MTKGAKNLLKRLKSLKQMIGKGFSIETYFMYDPDFQYCEVYVSSDQALSFMELNNIQRLASSTYVIPKQDSLFIRVS